MRFDDCYAFIRNEEGGFCNNKCDAGGATKWGVTQGVYDAYRRNAGRLVQPVMLLDEDECQAIYRVLYWKPIKGDSLTPPVDLLTFDAAINTGVRQAALFLQRALGVSDDGIIGPGTLAALQQDVAAGHLDVVVASMIEQRRSFYKNLAVTRPQNTVFLKGWLNRCDHLEKALA